MVTLEKYPLALFAAVVHVPSSFQTVRRSPLSPLYGCLPGLAVVTWMEALRDDSSNDINS